MTDPGFTPSEPSSNAAAPSPPWPRIAVFGAGAVGCFHGARFAQAGAPVVLIGRPGHVQAIRDRGLLFESAGERRRIAIEASTDARAVADADLVLLCVKTRDTASAAAELAGRMRAGAILVSLQNGVENVALIREASGLDPMAAVVYVAASMPAPGHLRHAGRGDLVLGEFGPPPAGTQRAPDRVRNVAALFERAGVPCPVSDDVRVDLWIKLVMNCAMNPVSALGRSRYGRMIDDAPTRSLLRAVVEECVAVARAEGVRLPSADRLHAAVLELGEAMREASSSTAQDLQAGRPTEIDALNGYVARRADAQGVAAPVNRSLHTLVKLLEAGVAAG
ncbi:MAG TPA: 2-dehydropantoate 2-reductase [Quisquiliibacterium sp.]|nr:2-dehydropantoate 2-reductase [Quisquiliibacterium sp.]